MSSEAVPSCRKTSQALVFFEHAVSDAFGMFQAVAEVIECGAVTFGKFES